MLVVSLLQFFCEFLFCLVEFRLGDFLSVFEFDFYFSAAYSQFNRENLLLRFYFFNNSDHSFMRLGVYSNVVLFTEDRLLLCSVLCFSPKTETLGPGFKDQRLMKGVFFIESDASFFSKTHFFEQSESIVLNRFFLVSLYFWWLYEPLIIDSLFLHKISFNLKQELTDKTN